MVADNQPRRTPGALERASRQHEPGRAAASADALSAALHPRAVSATRCAPRHYGLGPGEWPQCADLGREVPLRYLVCRKSVDLTRFSNPDPHAQIGFQPKWN